MKSYCLRHPTTISRQATKMLIFNQKERDYYNRGKLVANRDVDDLVGGR